MQEFVRRHVYSPLTYIFLGDLAVLHKRFMAREVLPERGRANIMWEEITLEAFAKGNPAFAELNIGGEIIKIDTTDFENTNFDKYMEIAYTFLQK